MKKTFRLLTAFIFVLTTMVSVFGQDATPTTTTNATIKPAQFNEPQGYLTLGLDVGLSYLTSDVKAAFGGWGAGLTLEKNLLHVQNSPIDFGVRGRLMYAKSLGFNTTPSTGIANNPAVNGSYSSVLNYTPEGSYYANHRTDQGELGLEAVLTLNRLREKTGLYATLFGGFGLDIYNVNIDQLNGSNQKYAYSTLKTPSVTDVRSFLDGSFETKADGFRDSLQSNFMPNLGIELGFHFSPRFMVVLGHKVTFTKTDLFDGQRWADNTTLTAQNDIHHYTNLQFKWIIGNRKRQILDGDPPKITILRPTYNAYAYNTYDNIESIKAEILGITFQEDATLTVNGLQANFKFKNNELTADVLLKQGENEIIVKAENPHGSNFKKLIINRLDKTKVPEPPVRPTDYNNNSNNNPNNNPNNIPNNNPNNIPNNNTVQSPRVKFITPASYSETDRETQAIRVQIDNVSNFQDATLTVNGRSITGFRFSYGELSYDVPLSEGQNSIVVAARNSAGSSSDAITVKYIRAVQRVDVPYVRISTTGTPSENTYGGCQTTIEARVENVAGRRDITMTVNGRSVTDFNYDISSKILRGTISLASGSNQIAIRAKNVSGEGSDRADVTCTQRQRNPPSVRISQPTNNYIATQKTIDVRATAQNVASKNDIEVYVNGFQTSEFAYYPFDKSVTTRINLNEGENSIRIRVANADGSNEDIVRVTYRSPVVAAPPRVTIQQPSSGLSSKTESVNFQATATNIANSNQIQVTLNGRSQAFNFDPSTRIITAKLPLDAGTNTIKVNVTNENGSDAATTTVAYSKSVVVDVPRPPRVTIMRPTDGSKVTDPSVTLEAQVDNATAARKEVKIILNGVEIEAAMNVMRQIRQRLSLVQGVNTITVRAVTKDGTDEKTVRVTYGTTTTPPSGNGSNLPSKGGSTPTNTEKLPTIVNFNVTQPVTDPFDPKPLVSVVTATLTKTTKSYIQFKVNNEDIKTFQYDDLTGEFRYSFPVKSGTSYTFYLRVYNLDGETEKTQVVKF
jgi:hypothetical protein